MPGTKVIKAKPVEVTRRSIERVKPVKERETKGAENERKGAENERKGAENERKVPAVRKNRAASCSRCPPQQQRGRLGVTGATLATLASRTNCDRRVRSSSTAPRLTGNWPKANPDCRKGSSSVNHAAAVSLKSGEASSGCPVQREQRSLRAAEAKYANQSHKAFTVIPPNPKKRREIQRKAEAELAALEELRLSRAMAYVSINPSSVGGCMSLEEVRLKQQQEMMQARRRKQQQVVKTQQVLEQTTVLTS
ncbi:uncharacterized protein zgc:194621 [Scomber scombrus]|uniref:Uncharacterized protein zgc:194621 n=1 Tax=Scomber scombrus TaxID=13677 RepID=A0AAV1PRZ9_SCOSC